MLLNIYVMTGTQIHAGQSRYVQNIHTVHVACESIVLPLRHIVMYHLLFLFTLTIPLCQCWEYLPLRHIVMYRFLFLLALIIPCQCWEYLPLRHIVMYRFLFLLALIIPCQCWEYLPLRHIVMYRFLFLFTPTIPCVNAGSTFHYDP